MPKRVCVIGAGFGGLSAAAYLARAKYDVTVLEKNEQPGGRALTLKENGFTFDLGPNWYLMPDVFEEFFADFKKKPTDYYNLVQLKPNYRVFTHANMYDVPTAPGVFELFDRIEPGSASRMRALLERAKADYETTRSTLLTQDWTNGKKFFNRAAVALARKPELTRSYHKRVQKVVKNETLQHILEFMVIFLGGSPQNIPALYGFMNYIDLELGVWYPQGGFSSVSRAFERVAKAQGTKIIYNTAAEKIIVRDGKVVGVRAGGQNFECEAVISGADYWHTETKLVPKAYRSYDEQYWSTRALSPSALLVSLGVSKPLPKLRHHNLFFDTDWDEHFNATFNRAEWAENPLLFVSAPAKTDVSMAPADAEALSIMAPIPAGGQPDKATLERSADQIIARIEQKTGTSFAEDIVVRDIRAQNYFKATFNALEGNAFGPTNTLLQTGKMRPRMHSKKLPNLFYVGQYTNPGTTVPMVIQSGKAVSSLVAETLFLGRTTKRK